MEFTGYDAEIRIPTTQYGFVSVHFNGDFEQIKDAHDELHRIFSSGPGIPEADFRDVVSCLVAGEPVLGGIELWEKMSQYQKDVCNEVKRAHKRLAYKNRE